MPPPPTMPTERRNYLDTIVENTDPDLTLEELVGMPVNKVCEIAWPVLSHEQRLRGFIPRGHFQRYSEKNNKSSVSGTGTNSGGTSPSIRDEDEADLVEAVNTAAEAFNSLPDKIETLQKLKSALFGHYMQRSAASEPAPLAPANESGNLVPPPSTVAKNRKKQRSADTSARSRKLARTDCKATKSSAQCAADPLTSLELLFSNYDSTKDVAKVRAIMNAVLTTPRIGVAGEVLGLIDEQLRSSLTTSNRRHAKNAKLLVLTIFAQCGLFMGHSKATETMRDVCGHFLVDMIIAVFAAVRKVEAPESIVREYHDRLSLPVLYLAKALSWRRATLTALQGALQTVLDTPSGPAPEAPTFRNLFRADSQRLSADSSEEGGLTEVNVKEEVVIDNRSRPSQSGSWCALVSVPYASQVELRIGEAVRCEQVVVLFTPWSVRSETAELHGTELQRGKIVRFPCGGDVIVKASSNALCIFEATVTADVCLKLDVALISEMRTAFVAVMLHAVKSVLSSSYPTSAAEGAAATLLSNASATKIFCGGLQQNLNETRANHAFKTELAEIDDATLSKKVRSRVSDAQFVRCVLLATAHTLSYVCATLSWESDMWREVIRRLAPAIGEKSQQGNLRTATAIEFLSQFTRYLIESVAPPAVVSPAQALEGVMRCFQVIGQQLAGGNIGSVEELCGSLSAALQEKRDHAKLHILAVVLLQQATTISRRTELHAAARVFRCWLNKRPNTHYLAPLEGCGAALQVDLRRQVHDVLSRLFHSLSVIIRQLSSSTRHTTPNRYLLGEAECGGLMLLTVSLLLSPLDAIDDMHIAQSRIAEQLLELLPNFSEAGFANSNSFSVEDTAESEVSSLLQSLIDQFPAKNITALLAVRGGSAQQSASKSLAAQGINANNGFANGQRQHGNVWQLNCGRNRWFHSKEATFDPNASASHSFVEISMKSADVKEVRIALIPTKDVENFTPTRSMMTTELVPGSFFFCTDGSFALCDENGVRRGRSVPLEEGDVIGIGFAFSCPPVNLWTMFVWWNGIRIASFVIPPTALTLAAGVPDYAQGSKACVEVQFAPSLKHESSWAFLQSQVTGRDECLPTMHEVSLFASHTLHALMYRCARNIAKSAQREAVSPLTASGGGHKDLAIATLVERSASLLQGNCVALVEMINGLPLTADTASSRVRLAAAFQVYNVMLTYLLQTLAVVCRVLGLTEVTFAPMSMVIESPRADRSCKVLAMQTIMACGEEAAGCGLSGLAPPHALWSACCTLGSSTTDNEYKPKFVSSSVPSSLTIEEGGKSVAFIKGRGEGKAAAFVEPPIPMPRGVPTSTSRSRSPSPIQHPSPGTDSPVLPFSEGGLDSCESNAPFLSTPTVAFSMRIFRNARISSTLGKLYFVGVSASRLSPTLMANSGGSTGTTDAKIFLLPDYRSECPPHLNAAELDRYKRNWFNVSEGIVYCSGDLITVTIDRRKRSIYFQRNGHNLGVLYTEIPSDVTKLYPCVFLYNTDATASLQFRPSECGARARALMRLMLRAWPQEFAPKAIKLLDDRSALILQVFQSDGNDFTLLQRNIAASSRKQRYTLIRVLGEGMEVLDNEGRHRTVPSDALIQDYNSPVSQSQPIFPQGTMKFHRQFVAKLVDVVTSAVLDGEQDHQVCLMVPRTAIRALRLLSQEPPDFLSDLTQADVECLLESLRKLIVAGDSIETAGLWRQANAIELTIQSAWSELDTVDEDQLLLDGAVPQHPEEGSSASLYGVVDTAKISEFACPSCGSEWGHCSHDAPISVCELLHRALLHGGYTDSPYSGIEGEWICDPDFSIHLTVDTQHAGTAVGSVRLTGEGHDQRGKFSFVGFLCDRYCVAGSFTYYAAEDVDGEDAGGDNDNESEEWPCEVCTFLNPLSEGRCGICGTPRPGSSWACRQCTYANNPTATNQCNMCGGMRPREEREDSGDAGHEARCTECHTVRHFDSFATFKALCSCTTCGRTTSWRPIEVFSGKLLATLTTQGDELDIKLTIGGLITTGQDPSSSSFIAKSTTFTVALMEQLLDECENLQGFRQRSVPAIATVTFRKIEEELRRNIVTPTVSNRISHQEVMMRLLAVQQEVRGRMGHRNGSNGEDSNESNVASPATSLHGGANFASGDQRALKGAIQIFCCRCLASWIPSLLQRDRISKSKVAEYFLSLRAVADQWFAGWSTVSEDAAFVLIDAAIAGIMNCRLPAHVALAITPPLSKLIAQHSGNSQAQKRKAVLLYSLAIMASTAHRHTREIAYRAITSFLESFLETGGPGGCNATPLLKAISQVPAVAGQQRMAVVAALHGLESGRQSSFVTATHFLLKGVDCILRELPVPAFFDLYEPQQVPHLVILPETKVSESGELIVGQVRGSVPLYPNQGGKYYYELVLPQVSNSLVMGWGSRLHEVQGSSQHVGSNYHSWGYDGRNKVRALGDEIEMELPRRTVPGDVIGALLDLEAKKMCWSVNGLTLTWLDIPLQGDGEALYPYVSANTGSDSCHVIIRLFNTQYRPEDYSEFKSAFDSSEYRVPSATAPQSYQFYKEVSALVNELNANGFSLENITASAAYAERVRSLLPQYPNIAKMLATSNVTSDDESLHKALLPYIRHLMALSAMATITAKRTDVIRDSPILWSQYNKAQDLLFFSARWAMIDTLLARKLVRGSERRPYVVTIDKNAVDALLEEYNNSSLASNAAAPLATRRSAEITDSSPVDGGAPSSLLQRHLAFAPSLLSKTITGQVFEQLKERDVYNLLTMFTVQVQEKGSVVDAGGVTRTMVTMMCDEMMYSYRQDSASSQLVRVAPVLPLFTLTDHSTYFNIVPNMEFLSAASPSIEATATAMLEWIGKLFGNAVLAGTLIFSLSFPRIIWKYLTRQETTIEEYYLDCSDSARGSLHDDDFLLDDDHFYRLPNIREYYDGKDDAIDADAIPLSNSSSSPPTSADEVRTDGPAAPNWRVPSCNHLADTEERHGRMLAKRASKRREAAEMALLHQYDKALEAIRRGFETVVPIAAVEQMRWEDLRQRVSGSDAATVNDILSAMDVSHLSDSVREMLTEAIQRMPATTRSKFLLFCTGQRRLPVPEKVQVDCGTEPQEIPTAHTCSPIRLRIQPYASVEELLAKLSIAIAHAYEWGYL